MRTAAPGPAELMRAIAERRDGQAFTQVFQQFAPQPKAFLKRGGLEDSICEALLQEVMLTVWRRAEPSIPRHRRAPPGPGAAR